MTAADIRALEGLQDNLRLRAKVVWEAKNLDDYDRHVERLLKLAKLLGCEPVRFSAGR